MKFELDISENIQDTQKKIALQTSKLLFKKYSLLPKTMTFTIVDLNNFVFSMKRCHNSFKALR